MRDDYSEAERATWRAYVDAGLNRLADALGAIPDAIPERSSGEVECPNCHGVLKYVRWAGGASVRCATTENCVNPVRFNILPGTDWPAPREG